MQRYAIEIDGKRYVVEVEEAGEGRYQVVVDGQAFAVRMAPPLSIPRPAEGIQTPPPDVGAVESGGAQSERRAQTELRAPMPGVVLSIGVRPGDRVQTAQQLLVLEAMKMKNPISSIGDGVVSEILVQEGQSVAYDDVLLKFEEA
ncbi:MAG TPA: acetyl-CoA carboxylase biotin carboxyl carrier protein subunit [Caldilineae bacterium]|nr:acetyl-CoA carboxylase biotin carboxyl carrier protein subunit [Caldilineae bacterium]